MTVVSNDPIQQDLVVVRGTTFVPNLAITTTDQYNVTTPVNIFGGYLVFMVKKYPTQTDDVALLTYASDKRGGITITDAFLGQAQLLIPAVDTLDTYKFPESKNQFYALKLFIGKIPELVIAQGYFTVTSRTILET